MWQSCLWNRVSKWKVLFWLLRTLVIFELFCYNMSIYKLYCCLLLLYTSEFAIFHGPSQAHFIPFCSWFDSSSINFWNVLGRSFSSLANVIGKCYFFSAEIRVLEISTHSVWKSTIPFVYKNPIYFPLWFHKESLKVTVKVCEQFM